MGSCKEDEMEKNIKAIDVLKEHNIDFVPIPVGGTWSKRSLVLFMCQQCEDIAKDLNKAADKAKKHEYE